MVAEPLEEFSANEIERVTRKVFHYLNAGLEFVSRRDEAKAMDLLRSMPLQKIFQGGVGTNLAPSTKSGVHPQGAMVWG